jgi:hypothetical protein
MLPFLLVLFFIPYPDTLCPPLSLAAATDEPDNPTFLATMDSLYPSWRTLIGLLSSTTSSPYDGLPPSSPHSSAVLGYLNIRNISSSHHDMHGEYTTKGFAFDCTHYAYSPFLMEPLWVTLTDYFSTFSLQTFLTTPHPSLKSN